MILLLIYLFFIIIPSITKLRNVNKQSFPCKILKLIQTLRMKSNYQFHSMRNKNENRFFILVSHSNVLDNSLLFAILWGNELLLEAI